MFQGRSPGWRVVTAIRLPGPWGQWHFGWPLSADSRGGGWGGGAAIWSALPHSRFSPSPSTDSGHLGLDVLRPASPQVKHATVIVATTSDVADQGVAKGP